MTSVQHMLNGVWFDRPRVEEAEYNYEVYQSRNTVVSLPKEEGSVIAKSIAAARERITKSLQNCTTDTVNTGTTECLAQENSDLRKLVDTLVHRLEKVEERLSVLESARDVKETPKAVTIPVGKPKPVESDKDDDEEEDDDDDEDLFGSESEDEETKKEKEARLAAYYTKKSKKPAVIAKSNIILDVKPWDDTTDMELLEKNVRSIEKEGLIWGPSKLMEVAFGIKKLQISCVVEDDKVGTDDLEEVITGFEDQVQSVDVVAFNKV